MPSASVSVKVDKQQSSTAVAPAQNAAAASAEAAAVAAAAAAAAANAVDNSTPIRQVLVIIEHKIRNLEKRKGKLETYRDMEKAGKELSGDMKVAVSKYGEVAQTLEFARDFAKQILQIATVSEKDQKKRQKKDEIAKKQGDISRIREVLIMQNMLEQLAGDAQARQDFVLERNGACKLEAGELALLDAFHAEVTPDRSEATTESAFKTAAQRAADHLSAAVESKPKPFGSHAATYADVRNVLKNIQKSGYFDKVPTTSTAGQPQDVAATASTDATIETSAAVDQVNGLPDVAPASTEVVADATETAIVSSNNDVVDVSATANAIAAVAPIAAVSSEPKLDFQEAPAAAAVPTPTFPPQQQPQSVPLGHVQQLSQQQQQAAAVQQPARLNTPAHQPQQQQPQQHLPAQGVAPTAVQPTAAAVIAPEATGVVQPPPQAHLVAQQSAPQTVRAVEQAYFKQHQYVTQMRPLAEVINAQNFYFLQESELDQPEVLAPTSPAAAAAAFQQQQQQQQLQQVAAQTSPQQQVAGVFAGQISPVPLQLQQQANAQTLAQSQAQLLLQQQQSNQLLQQQQQQIAHLNRSPVQQQPQQQQTPQQQSFVGGVNPSFPNGPLFAGSLKPSDLQQIAGFANANAPLAIPLQHLAQSAAVSSLLQHEAVASKTQQQQQLTTFPPQQQQHQLQQQQHLLSSASAAQFLPNAANSTNTGNQLAAALGANSPLGAHSLLLDGRGNPLNGNQQQQQQHAGHHHGHHNSHHHHHHQQHQHQQQQQQHQQQQQQHNQQQPHADSSHRGVPEISEWKPEDVAGVAVKSDDLVAAANEWKTSSGTGASSVVTPASVGGNNGNKFYANNEPEVSDWNDDSSLTVVGVGGVGGAGAAAVQASKAVAVAEEPPANAWSTGGAQQRFPYRGGGGSGGYGRNSGGAAGAGNNNSGTNAGSNRGASLSSSGVGGRNAAAAAAGDGTNVGASNGSSSGGGYNRPQRSGGAPGGFQTNGSGARGGGAQQQAQQQQQTGSGGGTGTFYRNNESFYQNGSAAGGAGSGYRGGAGGDKSSSSGGGYRDGGNKNDASGFRSGGGNNSFRSREAASGASAINAPGGGGGGSVRSGGRSNNRYASDSAERGQSSGSRTAGQGQGGHRNGPSPPLGGGGQQQQQSVGGGRPLVTATKHNSVYGGGPRPSGAGHNRQGVNV